MQQFPVVSALGVDHAATLELQEQIGSSVFDVQQLGNVPWHLVVDLGQLEAVLKESWVAGI